MANEPHNASNDSNNRSISDIIKKLTASEFRINELFDLNSRAQAMLEREINAVYRTLADLPKNEEDEIEDDDEDGVGDAAGGDNCGNGNGNGDNDNGDDDDDDDRNLAIDQVKLIDEWRAKLSAWWRKILGSCDATRSPSTTPPEQQGRRFKERFPERFAALQRAPRSSSLSAENQQSKILRQNHNIARNNRQYHHRRHLNPHNPYHHPARLSRAINGESVKMFRASNLFSVPSKRSIDTNDDDNDDDDDDDETGENHQHKFAQNFASQISIDSVASGGGGRGEFDFATKRFKQNLSKEEEEDDKKEKEKMAVKVEVENEVEERYIPEYISMISGNDYSRRSFEASGSKNSTLSGDTAANIVNKPTVSISSYSAPPTSSSSGIFRSNQ